MRSIEQRWKRLADILGQIYKDNGHDKFIKSNLKYLKEAYLFTERLWEKQLNEMTPKIVILSEAPLYGKTKSYFYNLETPLTVFFKFSDAEPIIPKETYLREARNKDLCNRKKFLLKTLNESGILILDLFPFAFNSDHTELSYRSMKAKEYRQFFQQTEQDHFQAKIDCILQKCNPQLPSFAFRYKRLDRRLGKKVAEVLNKKKLLEKNKGIPCIASNNMWIDEVAFGNLFLPTEV